MRQIAGRARAPCATQVLGVRDDDQFGILELPGDQPRIARRAPANGEVEALLREIDVAVAQMRFDRHLRITLAKLGEKRQYAVVPVGRGHADPQHAGGRRLLPHRFALGFGQLQ
jgi:hypothetical protein